MKIQFNATDVAEIIARYLEDTTKFEVDEVTAVLSTEGVTVYVGEEPENTVTPVAEPVQEKKTRKPRQPRKPVVEEQPQLPLEEPVEVSVVDEPQPDYEEPEVQLRVEDAPTPTVDFDPAKPLFG